MGDAERQPLIQSTPNTPINPLLASDRQYITSLNRSEDFIACHVRKIHGEDSWIWSLRHNLQHFLSSKWGHYFVIILVAADISCIFADFLVSLHVCEHAGEKGFDLHAWQTAQEVLGVTSLAFSSLFMAELLASVFAFGFHYFTSAFHIFDAAVILIAFIIDLVLRAGPLEEAGSLVVVLRLWRVFKIIEEFSSGAEDEISELQETIEVLRREKEDLGKENEQLKARLGDDARADGNVA